MRTRIPTSDNHKDNAMIEIDGTKVVSLEVIDWGGSVYVVGKASKQEIVCVPAALRRHDC